LKRRIRALVLYDPNALHTSTVLEHLNSIRLYTGLEVSYLPAVGRGRLFVDLDHFDVVIQHYSIRVAFGWHIAPEVEEALARFGGLKVQMVQDEYDYTERTRQFIERHGTHLFFTCVPEEQRELVYPSSRFPDTTFVSVLTGYVPVRFVLRPDWRPMASRRLRIGYRGRSLSPRYGHLGREKQLIGERMYEICRARGVPIDIEWNDSKRIYGDAWFDFIASVRATLGTESGANVFDDTGAIANAVAEFERVRPNASYEEIWRCFVAPYEGRVKMNQVSPRVFEAIGLATALVLFEGEYSGVVEAERHYIPLRKDFSNVDDVLRRLEDVAYLTELTERTYEDVIGSRRYSYSVWGRLLSDKIASRLGVCAPTSPVLSHEMLVAESCRSEPIYHAEHLIATNVPITRTPITVVTATTAKSAVSSFAKVIARATPLSLRKQIRTILPEETWTELRRRVLGV
jgi:hypothetical protein